MKIFGLGIPELVLILVVALLIFGPKNLPKLGGMLGRSVKKLRARTDEKFKDADESDAGTQPA
ncbi:twin-arginine translocase TatA/TatE family subunit [Raoultibacter massiliensis]|uniref:twin-arginine translocase TatA/TatE family subunit n=1 Tax=Raoultibacter massiliensis TaxID=1852371 RepID=UPI000C8573DB